MNLFPRTLLSRALLLLHAFNLVTSTQLTRELCVIDSQHQRQCLMWTCTKGQTFQSCAEDFVTAVCTSNLSTDTKVQQCCVHDPLCRTTLIETTRKTLVQTSTDGQGTPDMQTYFSEIYAHQKWGTAALKDNGPRHMYSGDGANANKCSSLINYINGDLINNKSVVEMGCGDMRVTQKLDFAQMTSYICIDVAPVAVEEATRVLGTIPACKNPDRTLKCQAFQGDGSIQLPSADVLLVKDVIMHWPTSLISSFVNTIVPEFQQALLTFEVAETDSKRPSIIPGEIAAVSVFDLDLPKELVAAKVLTNVCKSTNKGAFLIERC